MITTIIMKESLTKFTYNTHEIIITDNCAGGWYRQIGSLNAFLHGGVLKHWYEKVYLKGDKRVLIYSELEDCSTETWNAIAQAMRMEPYEVKETFTHTSLWDFFTHIGYNYKTKNYKVLMKVLED